jgi:hypothetical protein
MRGFWWCLMLPGFLNCSGQNVVAGKEKTKSEQLEAALPAWCSAVCEDMKVCEEGCDCDGDSCSCPSIGEDCADDCQAEMSRWVDGTDKCASVGERLRNCIEEARCDLFEVTGLCQTTAAERAACPGDDVDDPPDATGGPSYPTTGGTLVGSGGSPSGGPTAGGTASVGGAATGYAGSVGYAGSYPAGSFTGGSGPTGEPVTCQVGHTTGQAGSANTPVTCDSGQQACSDGNDYSWFCVTNSEDRNICSCSLNGSVVKAFDWTGACPDVVQINAICGWNLVSNL